MNYTIFAVLLLLSFSGFSQSNQSYGTLRPSAPSSTSSSYYEDPQIKEQFIKYKDLAFEAYEKQDYDACVYYYEIVKNCQYYNSCLDYVAGVSYHKIGETSKAKKYLRLSSKRGFYEAKKYLEENF